MKRKHDLIVGKKYLAQYNEPGRDFPFEFVTSNGQRFGFGSVEAMDSLFAEPSNLMAGDTVIITIDDNGSIDSIRELRHEVSSH